MPRARNAIVASPLASSASRRCATISASADSDVPHVFNDFDTIADTSPERRRRSGITCVCTISCISYGTPGTAYTTLPSPTGQHSPGAVPIGFDSDSPPSGTSAWRRLFCGMSRSRVRNIVRDVLGQLHPPHERHAHQLGDRVAREVVLGRADPAADEHRVGARQQVAQRLDDARLVVADHPVLVGVDARRGELLADPGAVRVDDLAEQQLRTDRKYFTSHGREHTVRPCRPMRSWGFPRGIPTSGSSC